MICPSRKCMKRGAESGKSTVCSLKCEKTCSKRVGCWKGRPRRNKSLIKLKIAVFSPIPSASVSKASRVNPGDLNNCRQAKRKSVITTCFVKYRVNVKGRIVVCAGNNQYRFKGLVAASYICCESLVLI